MEIYCIEEFKKQFELLKRKNSYKDLESSIIEYFFNKNPSDLKSGTRLNNSDTTPYIKKRIKGSGGYRVYYLFIIINELIYLMFIHPKTGPYGAENITDDAKAELYKDVLEAIRANDIHHLTLNEENDEIIFTKAVTNNIVA